MSSSAAVPSRSSAVINMTALIDPTAQLADVQPFPVHLASGVRLDRRVVLQRGVWVGAGSTLEADVSVGAFVKFGPGVSVGPFATIGVGSSLYAGARLGAHTTLGAHVSVAEGAHIGYATRLDDEASVGAQARVGAEVLVGRGTMIGAGVVVPDGAALPPRTQVVSSADLVVREVILTEADASGRESFAAWRITLCQPRRNDGSPQEPIVGADRCTPRHADRGRAPVFASLGDVEIGSAAGQRLDGLATLPLTVVHELYAALRAQQLEASAVGVPPVWRTSQPLAAVFALSAALQNQPHAAPTVDATPVARTSQTPTTGDTTVQPAGVDRG